MLDVNQSQSATMTSIYVISEAKSLKNTSSVLDIYYLTIVPSKYL